MARVYNFSAGPAALPDEVLQQAADEMLDWHGTGMSVMEMSHRGKAFISIAEQAEADLRTLLAVPDEYHVLFMQGGGLAENAIVPLNLLRGGSKVDLVQTGSWSKKSVAEARKYADVHVAASNAQPAQGRQALAYIPDLAGWSVRPDASYLHICGNETIDGVEFREPPDMAALGASGVPLVCDASSHILSRPMDVSRYGLMFGGAQKNIGPAGVTLVIVRKDLVGNAHPMTPTAFDYAMVAANKSMYNTPPTYGIYIAGLVFQWLLRQGGLAAMAQRNEAKAQLLYAAIDGSSLYVNHVDPACRSWMNVPFRLKDESLNDAFLAGADAAGLKQLKGHKSVGGMRASIYNAMSLQGVQALVDYLREFERTHG